MARAPSLSDMESDRPRFPIRQVIIFHLGKWHPPFAPTPAPLSLAAHIAYARPHPRGACVQKQVESGTARDPSNLIPVIRAEGGSAMAPPDRKPAPPARRKERA